MKVQSLMALVGLLWVIWGFNAIVKATEDDGKWRESMAKRDPFLDFDKDGKVDHGELRTALGETLDAIDKEKDKKFYRNEGHVALQKLKERFDKAKDGKIEHSELREHLAKLREYHPLHFKRLVDGFRDMRERLRDKRR